MELLAVTTTAQFREQIAELERRAEQAEEAKVHAESALIAIRLQPGDAAQIAQEYFDHLAPPKEKQPRWGGAAAGSEPEPQHKADFAPPEEKQP